MASVGYRGFCLVPCRCIATPGFEGLDCALQFRFFLEESGFLFAE
jgi:hypothetical protein